MCNVLRLSRSAYYYEAKERVSENVFTSKIIEIFRSSRQNYGTCKIKVELRKQGYTESRRRIGRIMNEQELVSSYTIAQFKPYKTICNELTIHNELNREIIGYSTSPNKDAQLVYRALSSIPGNLEHINLFHTDRGNEFKNKLIDAALETFKIKRSLRVKGCPYDNAVAEATFKIFKTEFVKGRHFNCLKELELELMDYIYWYNLIRIHGTLGYKNPIQYKLERLKKAV